MAKTKIIRRLTLVLGLSPPQVFCRCPHKEREPEDDAKIFENIIGGIELAEEGQ